MHFNRISVKFVAFTQGFFMGRLCRRQDQNCIDGCESINNQNCVIVRVQHNLINLILEMFEIWLPPFAFVSLPLIMPSSQANCYIWLTTKCSLRFDSSGWHVRKSSDSVDLQVTHQRTVLKASVDVSSYHSKMWGSVRVDMLYTFAWSSCRTSKNG